MAQALSVLVNCLGEKRGRRRVRDRAPLDMLADEIDRLWFLYTDDDLRWIAQTILRKVGPQPRSRRTTNRADWDSTTSKRVIAEIAALHMVTGWPQLDVCEQWQNANKANPRRRQFTEMDAQSLRKQVFDR